MLRNLVLLMVLCGSIESIVSFDSNVPAYEWQTGDVCIRGRSCFKSHVEFVKSKLVFYIQKKKVLKQVDCPCPKNKPYICGGRQSNFCALSKQACDSFILLNKNTNPIDRTGLFVLQTCANDLTVFE